MTVLQLHLKKKEDRTMNNWKNFTKGFIKENPVLVMLLGCCPTLGTTTSAINGLSMGLATTFVLVCSNIVISLIKNLIPDKVRIPSYIVVIASFVTVIDLLMQAYLPGIYETLGLFIPLIVVNCIVLGRAEASWVDGLGMGLGYALALMILGAVREVLGSLSIFGWQFIQADGILVFVLAPGAFFGLAYFIAVVRRFNK